VIQEFTAAVLPSSRHRPGMCARVHQGKYQDRCLPPIRPFLQHFEIVVAKLFSVV